MDKKWRYIVWREQTKDSEGVSVRALLDRFPAVKILKFKDPDYAVVLMDLGTEKKIRQLFPDLCIEEDVQYRVVSTQ